MKNILLIILFLLAYNHIEAQQAILQDSYADSSTFFRILFGDPLTYNNYDVNLFRDSANILKTNDKLEVNSLRIGHTEIISEDRLAYNLFYGNVIQTVPDAIFGKTSGDVDIRAGDGVTGYNIALGYGVNYGRDLDFYGGTTDVKFQVTSAGNGLVSGTFKAIGGYLSGDASVGGDLSSGGLVFKDGLYISGSFSFLPLSGGTLSGQLNTPAHIVLTASDNRLYNSNYDLIIQGGTSKDKGIIGYGTSFTVYNAIDVVLFTVQSSGDGYFGGIVDADGYKVLGTAYKLANWGSSSATSLTAFADVKERVVTLSDGSTITVLTKN